jgi:hypothetical protein
MKTKGIRSYSSQDCGENWSEDHVRPERNKLVIRETTDYIFAVSDEEIKGGDWFIGNDKGCKEPFHKIIAHLPKDDASELDLPLLPEMVVEDVEDLAVEYSEKHGRLPNISFAFADGYKAATKTFSEDDLRKAQQAILCNQKDAAMNENYAVEYIQSLKQPKHFIAEMVQKSNNGSIPVDQEWEYELKTITINDKQVLVGKYECLKT